jgi:hypothetical protein
MLLYHLGNMHTRQLNVVLSLLSNTTKPSRRRSALRDISSCKQLDIWFKVVDEYGNVLPFFIIKMANFNTNSSWHGQRWRHSTGALALDVCATCTDARTRRRRIALDWRYRVTLAQLHGTLSLFVWHLTVRINGINARRSFWFPNRIAKFVARVPPTERINIYRSNRLHVGRWYGSRFRDNVSTGCWLGCRATCASTELNIRWYWQGRDGNLSTFHGHEKATKANLAITALRATFQSTIGTLTHSFEWKMNYSVAVELNDCDIRRDVAKILTGSFIMQLSPNEVIDSTNKMLINFFAPKARLVSHEHSTHKPRIHHGDRN